MGLPRVAQCVEHADTPRPRRAATCDGLQQETPMFGLLVLICLGAVFFFIVPSIIPPDYRSAATGNLARVVGVLFILFAVASTSFVFVPDGHVGHLFRVYGGGPLTGGRIIAADAENG